MLTRQVLNAIFTYEFESQAVVIREREWNYEGGWSWYDTHRALQHEAGLIARNYGAKYAEVLKVIIDRERVS